MNMRQASIYFYLYMIGKSERCKKKRLLTRQLFQTKNDKKIFWETNHNYICLNAVRCAYNEGCFLIPGHAKGQVSSLMRPIKSTRKSSKHWKY